jgi:hypothetical protein
MYDSTPLDQLVALLIERGLQSFDAFERGDLPAQHAISDQAYAVGKAIVARGAAGAAALRPLLDDPRDGVQLLGASWLVKLDPALAAPVLERLKRDAGGAIASNANLALMQARDNGLLPTG